MDQCSIMPNFVKIRLVGNVITLYREADGYSECRKWHAVYVFELRVVVDASVSEKHSVANFRTEDVLQPRRWRQYISPKRWHLLTILQCHNPEQSAGLKMYFNPEDRDYVSPKRWHLLTNLVTYLNDVTPSVCSQGQFDSVHFYLSQAFDNVPHAVIEQAQSVRTVFILY
jgi:hypothetical protein